MNEEVFFDNGVVSVTSARCILGGKTIPVRSLNAVSMLEESPSRFFPILLIIIGLICLGCGAAGFGIVLALLGGLWLYFQKSTYYVNIETSSGSSNAYSSTDRAHIEEVVCALNDAIVSQAR